MSEMARVAQMKEPYGKLIGPDGVAVEVHPRLARAIIGALKREVTGKLVVNFYCGRFQNSSFDGDSELVFGNPLSR